MKPKDLVTPNTAPPGTALAPAGLRVVARSELSAAQREAVRRYFQQSVFAALTPLALGPGHPFPRLRRGSLAVAVALQQRRDARLEGEGPLLAIVQLPSALPRTVSVPSDAGRAVALLEDVVVDGVGDLFPGRAVEEAVTFRIAGERVELAAGASRRLERALLAALKRHGRDVDRIAGPLRPDDLDLLEGGLHPGLRIAPAPANPPAATAEPRAPEPVLVAV